jgi:hypothetical protein
VAGESLPHLNAARIGMMVTAAEILCTWDHTNPIHEKIARPIHAALPHRTTAKPVVRSPCSRSSVRKRAAAIQ